MFILCIPNKILSQNDSINIIQEMREHILYLASDKLKGRLTGSSGEKKAAKYIAKKFCKLLLVET